jgi:hypothetical protein
MDPRARSPISELGLQPHRQGGYLGGCMVGPGCEFDVRLLAGGAELARTPRGIPGAAPFVSPARSS